MKQQKDYDWFVTLSLVLFIVVFGLGLSSLKDVSTNTILWFIFAAVVGIGRASLSGQAAGLGEIIDMLRQIRDDDKAQESINILADIRDNSSLKS